MTDDQGQTGEISTAVLVIDAEEVGNILKGIWSGMNQALINGDVPKAVSHLNYRAAKQYKPVFEALLPYMSEIISSYSPLQRVSVPGNIGEYAINRTSNGKNNLFFVYFLKDIDGIWRLDAM